MDLTVHLGEGLVDGNSRVRRERLLRGKAKDVAGDGGRIRGGDSSATAAC